MAKEPEIYPLAGYSLSALPGPFVVISVGTKLDGVKGADAYAIQRVGMSPKQARDIARDLVRCADDADRLGKMPR